MSVQKFQVGSANSLLAQPDTEQLYFRSDNAADTGNLTLTGELEGSGPGSETQALIGKREVITTDAFVNLTAAILGAAQTGVVSVYAAGIAASGFIIISTQPANNDTLRIGLAGFQQTYTFKTALSGNQANVFVSATGAPANNDTITINGRVYTFKTSLTGAANEIHINGQDGSLTNLAAAINGTGTPGTDYGTGTSVNAYATSGAVAAHVIILTAKAHGTIGNAITLAKSGANLDIGGSTFAGGTGGTANEVKIGADVSETAANLVAALNFGSSSLEGVTYGQGTAANPYISAIASASLLTITDKIPCKRQLAWAIDQSVGATIGIALPSGGVDGTPLATLAAGATASYNQFSLHSEDLVATTLPALLAPTTDAIYVGGKVCTLRFKMADPTDAVIPVGYETSTDNTNWATGLTNIDDLGFLNIDAPLFIHPEEQNIEYIRLVFGANVNATDTALDAAVIS